MNYQLEGWEDQKYRGKRKKPKTKKASHKHTYRPIIICYSFNDHSYYSLKSYCTICGKVREFELKYDDGSIRKVLDKYKYEYNSLRSLFWICFPKPEHKDEVERELKAILPSYNLSEDERIFELKYIKLNDLREGVVNENS